MTNKPYHVAIIMDGNGRWAKKRGLPPVFGHRKGAKRVRDVIYFCRKHHVKVLSLFALSVENFSTRSRREVDALIELLSDSLTTHLDEFRENNIKLKFIGDMSVFPDTLISKIADAEQITSANYELEVLVAINYSGRWDIAQAANQYASYLKHNTAARMSNDKFSSFLSTSNYPDPDLLIRTGGHQRISNFMLWQSAYTELCFLDSFWPDFTEALFLKALSQFALAERNFGGRKKEECYE